MTSNRMLKIYLLLSVASIAHAFVGPSNGRPLSSVDTLRLQRSASPPHYHGHPLNDARQRQSTSLSAAPTMSLSLVTPSLKAVGLTCLIPSLLGFYKSEYGVSYAYGAAISSTALLVLASLPSATSIAAFHSMALLFYGARLNAFLLYRELTIPRFAQFREKLEAQAESKGSRLARTPMVLGVTALYMCMVAPILVTASCTVASSVPMFGCSTLAANVIRSLVGLTWAGIGVAALGDFTKTWVKHNRGENRLVTDGIYNWLRHPNYTGEFIAWTASALVGVLLSAKSKPLTATACILGAVGIDFVLVMAGTGLERKQREKYGAAGTIYKTWVAKSWPGFVKSAVNAGEKE